MKYIKYILLSCVLLCAVYASAESPKREFRAVWLAAVGVDWPDKKVTTAGNSSQITAQKAELTGYLDKLVAGNVNAILYHVRPMADAFYKSSYEPWSHYLTGTRGKDPGYDPLAFAVEEAHKRGIEIHAWVNPFRHMASGVTGTDPIKSNNSSWLLNYSNTEYTGTWLDPGNPNVRAHIVKVIKEIVTNYDIDGVVFDDYFYPYGGTSDSKDKTSQNKYNTSGKSIADWRRDNIDQAIKATYDMIQSTKPYVRFGVSPFGIYSNTSAVYTKYGTSKPNKIEGLDAYNVIYCNTLEWMKGGYVDYISPQLYWSISDTKQSYKTLSKWWSDMAKKFSDQLGSKKVHFFSSQDCSAHGTSELGNQINYNREYTQQSAPGSVFFSYDDYISKGMPTYLKSNKFTQPALPPAMDWKSTTALAAPTNVKLNGSTLSWSHSSAKRFTVYAYTKGTNQATALASSSNLVGVVYGNSIDLSKVSGYASKTLAVCAYDRYGNEYAPGLYNAVTTSTVALKASTYNVTLSAPQGGSAYQDVTITASGLTDPISVATNITKTLTPECLSNWNNKTGGTLRIKLNTSQSPGTYSGYVAVQSGSSARIEINVTATITGGTTSTPTLSISKLWSKTVSQSGYLSTGAENRSMAYYNGKLYIPSKSAGSILVVDASTGTRTATLTIGDTNFSLHNVRITADGQLLYGNTKSATQSPSITVYKSSLTSGGSTEMGKGAIVGRSDYFYSYGSLNGSGFLLALSNTGNGLTKIPFASGSLQTAVQVSNSALPAAASAKAIPAADGTSFYATAKSFIPTKHSIASGALLESFGSDKPKTVAASGLAVFTVQGNTYMITPADMYGGFEVFDITKGLGSAKKVINATSALGSTDNAAMTVDFCTYVSGNSIYVYVLAPDNGIAAYKITYSTSSTAVEDVLAQQVWVSPTLEGVHVRFSGTQSINIYGINGTLVHSTIATDEYACELPQGMYIIRVGNSVHKFMK